LRVGYRVGRDHRGAALHGANEGGKRSIGGNAPRGEAQEAHGNGSARGFDDVPTLGQIDLFVGVKIGRLQFRCRAEIDVGSKTRRYLDGKAQSDERKYFVLLK
jgi:hypothetical protein